MFTSSATIVQRLWNYCNVLRDDGMSHGDYVEQLTYSPPQNKSPTFLLHCRIVLQIQRQSDEYNLLIEHYKAAQSRLIRERAHCQRRITIVPEWAKILDFETRIPQAQEELVLSTDHSSPITDH
jgi:hypothetical protein